MRRLGGRRIVWKSQAQLAGKVPRTAQWHPLTRYVWACLRPARPGSACPSIAAVCAIRLGNRRTPLQVSSSGAFSEHEEQDNHLEPVAEPISSVTRHEKEAPMLFSLRNRRAHRTATSNFRPRFDILEDRVTPS